MIAGIILVVFVVGVQVGLCLEALLCCTVYPKC
jgi:hypothetical protein